MAFGIHWEWRGFGRLPEPVEKQLRAACEPLDGAPSVLADTYLFVPGNHANVKLRDGQLKFKRLVARDGPGLELWREDEAEIFDFPLRGAQAGALCRALGCRPPGGGRSWALGESALLAALDEFTPGLRRLEVTKRREQFRAHREGLDLLVEISRIESPTATDSVSIEGPALDAQEAGAHREDDASLAAVRSFAHEVGVDDALAPRNYLEMIAEWLDAGD